ncbi:ABC transporter substrate-binding protein [Georgenia sp. EYE_87]|uniref:ABC transporter substrate-binding protein n=1 Tax=Georgenia sp. EYE_87 TaxID=2853448 RepID=UPI002004CD90|nr:ABC transporter substrate-binding protein [Georgenia sp. EYE_87]MCK6212436.1 ABC transporter substrate-binding protein [Georgenia sp. EYE_87]
MYRRRITTATLAGTLALTLLACSGEAEPDTTDDGGAATGGAAGTETVTLGLIPIIDVAPVYVGMEQGFFEDEGIELELSTGQGGAAIVPGVVSGSIDMGFGNNLSLVIGNSSGLPLRVIASGVDSTGDPEQDPYTIVTADDSLQRPADLEGRTVAVNTLNAIGDTVVRASVRADGGDPDAVEFVEMPFPSMTAALVAGDVDAAWQVEPFITLGESDGVRVLTTPLNDFTDETIEVSSYFTSLKFAEENPELVDRFRAAIEKSLTYSQENPDAVREVLPSYLEVEPDLAERLILPAWNTEVSEPTFEIFAELAGTDGLIQGDVDLDTLLAR